MFRKLKNIPDAIKNNRRQATIGGSIFILGVTLIVVGALSRSQSLFGRAADEITPLTTKLIQQASTYNTAGTTTLKTNTLAEMQATALMRKQLLQDQLKSSPANFLNYVMSSTDRAKMPADLFTKGLVEADIDVKGEYTRIHFDNKSNKKPQVDHTVTVSGTTTSGAKITSKTYTVRFVKPSDTIPGGTKIAIKGIGFNGQVILQEPKNITKTANATRPTSTGERKILALMINFQDNVAKPTSKAAIDTILFSTTERLSVTKYFKQASYQQLNMSGKSFDWITIPTPDAPCDDFFTDNQGSQIANYLHWANLADQEARNRGENLDSYQHVMYIFSSQHLCKASNGISAPGFAKQPGKQSWINIGSEAFDINTYVHELGHNLGLPHASFTNSCMGTFDNKISCPFDKYDFYSGQYSEYGDIADSMGGFALRNSFGDFNVASKYLSLQWIKPEKMKIIETSGSYTVKLTPLELVPSTNTNEFIGVRIPKRDSDPYTKGNDHSYFIEYRQPIGNDNNNIGVNGVQIHIWHSFISTGLIPYNTQLVRPIANDTSTITLDRVNSSFTDQANGIQVTLKSKSSSSAELQINYTSITGPTAETRIPIQTRVICPSSGQSSNADYRIFYTESSTTQPPTTWSNTNPVSGTYTLRIPARSNDNYMFIALQSTDGTFLPPDSGRTNGLINVGTSNGRSYYYVKVADLRSIVLQYPDYLLDLWFNGTTLMCSAPTGIGGTTPPPPQPNAWNIQTKITCENGKTPTGQYRTDYIPNPLYFQNPVVDPLAEKFGPYFTGDRTTVVYKTLQSDYANYTPNTNYYFTILDANDRTLTPKGSVAHSSMEYGEFFCYADASGNCLSGARPYFSRWHNDALPTQQTYAINFVDKDTNCGTTTNTTTSSTLLASSGSIKINATLTNQSGTPITASGFKVCDANSTCSTFSSGKAGPLTLSYGSDKKYKESDWATLTLTVPSGYLLNDGYHTPKSGKHCSDNISPKSLSGTAHCDFIADAKKIRVHMKANGVYDIGWTIKGSTATPTPTKKPTPTPTRMPTATPTKIAATPNPRPNCSITAGPTGIYLGESATFTGNFVSAPGSLAGAINAGQAGVFKWSPTILQLPGTSATRTFTWKPAQAGTYDVFCRAWNDGIAECRGNATYVDGPPRYLCAGPNATRQFTVTVPPSGTNLIAGNVRHNNVGVANITISICNGLSPQVCKTTRTDNTGRFALAGFIKAGQAYAVRIPPVSGISIKTVTSSYSVNHCSPAGTTPQSTPLGSASYECQIAGNKDCSGPNSSNIRERCDFNY